MYTNKIITSHQTSYIYKATAGPIIKCS